MSIKYIFDTCSWIEMRESYRRKVFPGAWSSVETFVQAASIASPYEVFEELQIQEHDEVFQWIRPYKDQIFLTMDKDMQMGVKRILKKYPGLIDVKNSKDGADPFIIQTAISRGALVVTEEKFSGTMKCPSIPDVCKAEGIKSINLIDVFEREGCSFR